MADRQTQIEETAKQTGRVIDLSHVVESGMTTHPGLPGPIVCDFLSRADSRSRYAEGVEFHIGRIDMVANTGTYIDSPFHRYENGDDISKLSLSSLVDMECVVVNVPFATTRVISAAAFANVDVRGKAVLVNTGWDVNWQKPAYLGDDNPHLTEDAAAALAERGAALVGIDSVNIDSLVDKRRPVHTILLGRQIPIVEHLCNLGSITGEARFFAAPVAVRGVGTFPVRAYAIAT
jgi:kynurenine formamidase